jgi:uncharacterized DUF497 family protein
VSTLNLQISFDLHKNNQNKLMRGLSFRLALRFEWPSALITEDHRHEYGETRFLAMGYLDARVHVIVFTPRKQMIHIISLRKANPREVKIYEKSKKS